MASLCQATTYNCTPLSVPGATGGQLNSINNSNAAVGFYDSGGVHHGLVMNVSNGDISTIDYPGPSGAISTQLYSINNNGVIVGTYTNSQSNTAGYFTWNSGNFSTITPPPYYTLNAAYGINDNGAISVLVMPEPAVGPPTFAILNADGTLSTVPGYSFGSQSRNLPGGLNNASQMLESDHSFGQTSLASPSGIIANIALPPPTPTYAFGVNNAGSVIGYGLTPEIDEPPYRDFTWDENSGAYSELLCQEPSLDAQPGLFGINDSGILVGQAIAYPQPGAAQFSISTTTLNFPDTPVGQTTAPMPVTITNPGNARLDMYAFGDVQLSNTGTAIFKSDGGCFTSSGPTTSLDPGASCTMNITATPNKQGQQTGTESFYNSSGTGGSLGLSVTGTVPPPTCQVSSSGTGQANLTMQDVNSGLQSIVLNSQTNATVNIPSFASGTTSPVTAMATQSNLSQPGQVTLQATNVAGASTLCSASFNASGGPPQWMSIGGSVAGKVSMVSNSNGTLQAFARGTDNALWTAAQTSPDGPWGTWQNLGDGLVSNPAVAMNGNHVLEVYVLGINNSLWTISQQSPGGPFGGWQDLGQSLLGDPSVTADANGDLHVFVAGADNALWTIAETAPGAWGNWTSLGGSLLNSPSAITNNGGAVEVFAVAAADHTVWHYWFDSEGNPQGWSELGGSLAGSPVAVVNSGNGLVEVVGRGTDNAVWYVSHPYGSPWGSFSSLGGTVNADPSAAFDQNGIFEVFARATDNGLWYIADTAAGPPSAWTGWNSLGAQGTVASAPTAAVNQDGRMAVFVEGSDTAVWTIEQPTAGSWAQ
ncbi:MAG TPA: hypothetical protein VG297_25105 [Bryobacteraceae bacterium]|nr:hypothetical protein [Bryobacteraceae bacterium]